MLLQLHCAHKSLSLWKHRYGWVSGGAQESVSLIALQMTARESPSKDVPEFLNAYLNIKLSFGKEVRKY